MIETFLEDDVKFVDRSLVNVFGEGSPRYVRCSKVTGCLKLNKVVCLRTPKDYHVVSMAYQ